MTSHCCALSPCTPRRQSGVAQKTDEVLVRDLRRSASELQRVVGQAFEPDFPTMLGDLRQAGKPDLQTATCAGGIRTHDLRLVKHVLQTGSRSCIVGRATRRWSEHCSTQLSYIHHAVAGWMIGFEPTTDVCQPAVAAASFKRPNEEEPRVRHCCRSRPNSPFAGRPSARAPHLGETRMAVTISRSPESRYVRTVMYSQQAVGS